MVVSESLPVTTCERTTNRRKPLTVPEIADDSTTLAAAMAYAAAGWYVGPLRVGTKHPGSRLGIGWPQQTSRDPKMLTAWFAGTSDGIFLHCGRSGAVVFDVDSPELVPRILAEHQHSAPYQSTRSDSPGRGHYVFAAPDGVILGNGAGKLGSAWGDVRGNNGVIVVEPSVHPNSEGRYQWQRCGEVPQLPAELLELLETPPHVVLVPPEGTGTGVSYWRSVIIGGDGLERYGSRSDAAMAAAVGYVNAGASDSEWFDAMTTPGAALDYALRDRNGKQRTDTAHRLERDWEKAVAFVRDRPAVGNKSSARLAISLARNRASLTRWSGQRGTTDCLVIGAIHDMADDLGSLIVSAACRSVSESSGVTASTAALSLKRLSDDGVWIRLEDAETQHHAATYRILLPAVTDIPMTTAEPDTRAEGQQQPHELARHDAFAWKGLGRIPAIILAALGDQGRSVSDLAELIGYQRRTVAKHLRALSDYDLASYSALTGTWVRIEHANAIEHLDAIADCLDTNGTAERRRQLYERHRLAYAIVCELRGVEWTLRPRLTPRQRERIRERKRERTAVATGRMVA